MKVPGTKVVFEASSREAILAEIGEVLDSGQMSNGRFVERLETTFKDVVVPGARHAVAVNTGTGALEIALRALDVSGTMVLCPTNTYAATAWAIVASGNTPVLVGCDDELQISLSDVARVIDENPRQVGAVVVTHVGGVISRSITELVSLCREHGILVVEDAAHAHGSQLGGRFAGTFGDAAAFSLFATKVITSAEGGMVVLPSEERASAARILRDQGKKPGTGNFHLRQGYNWRLSEPHAVIGHHHALSFPARHRSRTETAAVYRRELAELPGFAHLELGSGRISSLYKYIVFTDHDLVGIPQGGRVYEVALHEQEVFAGRYRSEVRELHPNLSRHRCLPLYDHMPPEQTEFVVSSLRSRFGAAR